MDILWFKVIALITFVIVGSLFSLAPLLFRKVNSRSRQVVISLADCFAGGIFLATGWVHLLPESAKELESIGNGIPLANMLSVCGFLVVFLIEKVFFLQSEDDYNFDEEDPAPRQPKLIISDDPKLSDDNATELLPTIHTETPTSDTTIKLINDEDSPGYPHKRATTPHSLNRQGHSHDHGAVSLVNNASDSSNLIQKLLPYILMIVLSVHSVIAGITMGVSPSIEKMAPLFIAIISHKWTESFALGVNLLKLENISKIVKCVIIYTAMVPIGLIVGSVLSLVLAGDTANFTAAILNGIASGTFIYIALVDILLEEFKDAKNKFFKYTFCFLGFVVITGLFLLFDEDEG